MSAPIGPHVPCLSIAGHFLSMQPTMKQNADPTKVWYRGDRHIEVYDSMAKYRAAIETINRLFNDPKQSLDSDFLIVEIITIVEAALK